MENKIHSRLVGCCGARTWSLDIGGFQIIYSVLNSLITCNLIPAFNFYKGAKVQEHVNVSKEYDEAALVYLKNMGLALFVTYLISYAVIFVSGIILIIGVLQKNSKKLRIWNIVQIIIIVLYIIAAVLSIAAKDYSNIARIITVVLLTIFFIRVVNIHRQELLFALPT